MVSNRNILLAALIVFNIALIAAAFIVVKSYNGIFWTVLAFDLAGAAALGYFSLSAYDRGRKSLREVPQNLAVVYGAGLYWLLQLLVAIPAICLDWQFRYVLSGELLLFGVFFIGICLLLIGRNYISATEAEDGSTSKNISHQRQRLAVLERLSQKYPDDGLLEQAFEKIRYADPSFLPELEELEQRIDRLIAELGELTPDCRTSRLESLNELLDERSIEIRSRKQKGG